MRNSTEIKKEMEAVESRLQELEESEKERQAAFESACSKYTAGKISVEDYQTAQQNLNLARQSLDSMRSRMQALDKEFKERFSAESRSELMKKIVQVGNQAKPLLDAYQKLRVDLAKILGDCVAQMIQKKAEYYANSRKYGNLLRELDPNMPPAGLAPGLISMPSEIAKELENLGLTQENRNLCESNYFNLPPVEFGQPIAIAEGELASKLDKQRKTEKHSAKRA